MPVTSGFVEGSNTIIDDGCFKYGFVWSKLCKNQSFLTSFPTSWEMYMVPPFLRQYHFENSMVKSWFLLVKPSLVRLFTCFLCLANFPIFTRLYLPPADVCGFTYPPDLDLNILKPTVSSVCFSPFLTVPVWLPCFRILRWLTRMKNEKKHIKHI